MSDDCEAEIMDDDSEVPQLLHVNNFSFSLSFYSESGKYSKRKKVVNWLALMIKQTREDKMQGGCTKYNLYMNIFYRNSGQFTTQRTVLYCSYDLRVGSPEI